MVKRGLFQALLIIVAMFFAFVFAFLTILY
jgi:hypothetical protein